MVDHYQLVQTSAVYVLNASAHFSADPPPSPPSLVTPDGSDICPSFTALSLDWRSAADSAPPTPALEPEENLGREIRGQLEDVDLESASDETELAPSRLRTAIHVLSTEAAALQSLVHVYTTHSGAHAALSAAVSAIRHATSPAQGGKLLLSGVGKSGLIARKLAATFTSLSVPALFLHPTEALHGDLGIILPKDVLLLVSYSGATPELLALLPHVHPDVRVILLTGQPPPRISQHGGSLGSGSAASSQLAALRPDAVVLPAPVHETEAVSFGVAAPMTSTTAAMAVGDALALAVASERWRDVDAGAPRPGSASRLASMFRQNHPGGAIGAASAAVQAVAEAESVMLTRLPLQRLPTVRDIAVPWTDVPVLEACIGANKVSPLALDVLKAAYVSASGWVRSADGIIFAPGRIRRLSSAELSRPVHELSSFGVPWQDLTALVCDTTVRDAKEWIRGLRDDDLNSVKQEQKLLLVLDGGEPSGVLEASSLYN